MSGSKRRSIATGKGDRGQTDLLYGRRVSKTHPRVRAYGVVDGLSVQLGVARAHARAELAERIEGIQRRLIPLMAELAADDADAERFAQSKLDRLGEADVAALQAMVDDLEARLPAATDWLIPGGTKASAFLQVARTGCRKAEREIVWLRENGYAVRELLGVYLNRLSDVIHLLAREDEVWEG